MFNEANLLERVDVWLERAAEPAALLDPDTEAPSPVGVANIDYDAKGQRLRIDYKNGASTFYSYDPLTFRLTQLLTRRNAAAFPGDDPQPATVAGWPGPRRLQNLHYTYDPAGNITHIQDDAQQTIYFRNKRVEPSNDYTYDALYRLIQATGREHLGQQASGDRPIRRRRPMPSTPSARGSTIPNDGNAMGTYIERYVYDAVGNFLQMQHRGSDPAHPGWTRAYDYPEASLIEDGSGGAPLKTSNRLSRTTLNPNGANPQPEPYQHDAHGNMVRMPHLGGGLPGPNMHWDYKDQLRQTDLGGGGAAFYVYDASGQRVRKVWEKAPGLTEERIYLGGFEIFRKHSGPIGANTATLERETLHVMDDKQRIALVETRTLDTAGNDPAPRQLIRYQFGNHLGSASLELDEQAQIISYEEYAPYGSSTYQAVRSQTETAKRYRYTGKERDEESGLVLPRGAVLRAVGWQGGVRCDPAWDSSRPNAYSYAASAPLTRIDADGRADKDFTGPEVPQGWTPPDLNERPKWPLSHADFSYRFGWYDQITYDAEIRAGRSSEVALYGTLNFSITKDVRQETGHVWQGKFYPDIHRVYANGMTLPAANSQSEQQYVMQNGLWYPVEMWDAIVSEQNELAAKRGSLASDSPIAPPSIADWLFTDYLLNSHKSAGGELTIEKPPQTGLAQLDLELSQLDWKVGGYLKAIEMMRKTESPGVSGPVVSPVDEVAQQFREPGVSPPQFELPTPPTAPRFGIGLGANYAFKARLNDLKVSLGANAWEETQSYSQISQSLVPSPFDMKIYSPSIWSRFAIRF